MCQCKNIIYNNTIQLAFWETVIYKFKPNKNILLKSAFSGQNSYTTVINNSGLLVLCSTCFANKDIPHTTMRGHLDPFWTMFDPASLLLIFEFWSTFGLKWSKMWLDMTVREHLKPFWAMFDPASLSCFFFQFWWTFWLKWSKILAEMEQNGTYKKYIY